MNISLNNINNAYSYPSFSSRSKDFEKMKEKKKQDQIITAKTKKVVSECATVALGASIVYFAMKHTFKINAIKSVQKKITELAKIPRPDWIIDSGNINILPFKVN